MQLIGLTGKARAGKDTVGARLASQYGAVVESFAGPLKLMLHAGLGLDPADYQSTEQKEAVIPVYGHSYRYLAQTLGTDWGRERVCQEIWLRAQVARLAWHRQAGHAVVYTDVRFENEAQMLREIGGIVVHVTSLRDSGLTGQAKAHVSEHGVLLNANDRLIDNHGTLEELYAKVDALWLSLMGMPPVAGVFTHG